MTHTTSFTLTRGEEEIELDVEYTVSQFYGATGPSWNDPGSPAEGGEIEELTVTRDGAAFILTADEVALLEAQIYDKHDYSDDGRDEPEWHREDDR